MLESKKVLKECIARGVDEEGLFGYAEYSAEDGYENLRFQETFDAGDVEISDDTVIVREAEARRLLQEAGTEEQEAGTSSTPTVTETSAASTAESETGSTGLGDFSGGTATETENESETGPSSGVLGIEIVANPNWKDQWDDAYSAIVESLARLGADISIELTVDATSEDGLERSDIERQIEENLTQRNIDHTVTYKGD